MNEGVVLWDATGNPQLSNRALVDLWGHRPTVREVQTAQSEAEVGNDASGSREVRRGRRTLEIEVLEVTGGSLGLIRDATERFELDRRRREMHRLVSHELKTPLASISGFGEMLQTYEMSGEELDNVAGMIRTEADRLSELVRAFLDIERLATDQWETERTTVDLVPVIESRIKALTAVAEARGQTLDLRIDGTPRINGVVQLISQLVENLVGNAIKYSPDGGKIGVELGQSGDGDSWLRVRDKGIGIPHEAIPHLFERFYRVPGTETEGSGLGLAFVKEVADRHGATVHVESEEGVGASFTIVFPPFGEVE
jgi:signal transduction histidine kinase